MTYPKYTYEVDPEKITSVVINRGGVLVAAKVALSKLTPDPESYRVFGLVSTRDDTRLTHMCYGLDYFDPTDVLDFLERRQVPFYFDAGTTMDQITISRRELEVAFYRLKMIDSIGEPEGDES